MLHFPFQARGPGPTRRNVDQSPPPNCKQKFQARGPGTARRNRDAALLHPSCPVFKPAAPALHAATSSEHPVARQFASFKPTARCCTPQLAAYLLVEGFIVVSSPQPGATRRNQTLWARVSSFVAFQACRPALLAATRQGVRLCWRLHISSPRPRPGRRNLSCSPILLHPVWIFKELRFQAESPSQVEQRVSFRHSLGLIAPFQAEPPLTGWRNLPPALLRGYHATVSSRVAPFRPMQPPRVPQVNIKRNSIKSSPSRTPVPSQTPLSYQNIRVSSYWPLPIPLQPFRESVSSQQSQQTLSPPGAFLRSLSLTGSKHAAPIRSSSG
jgi:hypothetical protein